jgi:hypothetical protein
LKARKVSGAIYQKIVDGGQSAHQAQHQNSAAGQFTPARRRPAPPSSPAQMRRGSNGYVVPVAAR